MVPSWWNETQLLGNIASGVSLLLSLNTTAFIFSFSSSVSKASNSRITSFFEKAISDWKEFELTVWGLYAKCDGLISSRLDADCSISKINNALVFSLAHMPNDALENGG